MTPIWDHYDKLTRAEQMDWDMKKAAGDPSAGKEPIPYVHDLSDTTPESLGVFVGNNQTRSLPAIVSSDELSGIFCGMNQYKRNGGREQQFYCSLYDGRIETTIRLSRGINRVPGKVQIPMLGGIQPGIFAEIRSADDPLGLLARLLLCPMYDHHYKGNSFKGQGPEFRVKVAQSQALIRSNYLKCLELEPNSFYLDRQSQEEFDAICESSFNQARRAPLPAHARIVGKRAGQILRIAGIAHIYGQAAGFIPEDNTTISYDTFSFAKAAIAIMHGYAMAAESRIQAAKDGDIDVPNRMIRFFAKTPASISAFRQSLTPAQRRSYSTAELRIIADALVSSGHIAHVKTGSANGSLRYCTPTTLS
jgi:hypothetical protein